MRLTRRSLLEPASRRLPRRSSMVWHTHPPRWPRRSASAAWKHGLSLFGELKYPEDFKQFDYVNPNAPKGGAARLIAFGTFDNFNIVVAGVKGTLAGGIDLIYDTLLVSALDEVAAGYGLLAEAVSAPDDHSSVTYRLRANAKWHDGKPVTRRGRAVLARCVSRPIIRSTRPITGTWSRPRRPASTRSPSPSTAPATASCRRSSGELNVVPKHWWEGTDKSGKKRDIGATTLEPPLGSGAYRIKELRAGPHARL